MLDISFKPEFYVKRAKGHPQQGHVFVNRKEDLSKLRMGQLVELHNSFTTGLHVKGFADRTEATDKTWKLIAAECSGVSSKSGESNMDEPQTITEAHMATEGTTKKSRTRGKKSVTATKGKGKTKTAGAPRRSAGQETPVVAEAISMLRRTNGATKAELVEKLGNDFKTAEGYVAALLTRIFKAKGYKLTAEAQEGSREKRYFIPADKGPDIDFKNSKG